MRVMLVSESLWGGTGRVISWLASRLAEDGHAVTLVLRSREGNDWYTPDARVTLSRAFSLYGWRSPMPSGGAHLHSFRRKGASVGGKEWVRKVQIQGGAH